MWSNCPKPFKWMLLSKTFEVDVTVQNLLCWRYCRKSFDITVQTFYVDVTIQNLLCWRYCPNKSRSDWWESELFSILSLSFGHIILLQNHIVQILR